jgi:hypothetical protein
MLPLSTSFERESRVAAMRPTLLASAVILALAGCGSTSVTPEGSVADYSWVRGEVTGTLSSPLPQVDEATRAAFEELGLVGVGGGLEGVKGELTARTAVGEKVRVKLKALDFENTTVSIRVGRVGDKALSLQLFRHIEEAL